MSSNSFGTLFRLTTFGESHGLAIGGIIEGCPAGLKIDLEFIQSELKRRIPGQSYLTTSRKEEDKVELLSGIFKNKTTGSPIGFVIHNQDQRSKDYSNLKEVFRPSHADYTYQQKYGIRDYRGGGRSSARETACRVVAGAIAKLILEKNKVSIHAFVKQVGPIELKKNYDAVDLSLIEHSPVRCPDKQIAAKMSRHIEKLKKEGDTAGGVIQCVIQQVPVGLGEPVFDKLNAVLGHAMLSINAVKGFELGSGFEGCLKKGSELNDEFLPLGNGKKILTKTNHSGGIQGGISNGMPIYFNVAFKPVSTIHKEQKSVNTKGEAVVFTAAGRHDPCVLPRAVPIVESMAALVMVDFLLLARANKL